MSVGSHQSVLIDLLDSTSEDEFALFVSTTELCTVGLGLVGVATSHPALRLIKTVADSLLRSFGIVRLGTEASFVL